ncbi:hypothetical protein BC832DRAFT_569165 [Gaertneriomyces semiglobifer]|nr:hypothetical protein BC832DRAFT_569165 [Gaertneriomyces semiglobifer]
MKISASFAVLLPLAASAVQAFKTCNVDTTELSAFGEYGVQKATLGFTLAVDSETKTYDPNVPMTVTVSGTGTFTDILLYAAASPFHQNHTGTWVDYDGDVYQTLDGDDESSIPAGCKKYGQAATLASKKSEAKSLPATFKWKPPKTPSVCIPLLS